VDLLKAIADLLRALAWPAVALLAMSLFRPELRALLGRFRRGVGLEFDPPPPQGGTTGTLPGFMTVPIAAGAALPGPNAFPTILPPLPASAEKVRDALRASPAFQGVTDAQRIEGLLHAAAYLAFFADAERTEGQIWASQVSLLEHLNALDAGDSPPNLKARFYDPAAACFAMMYAGYSFEAYLGFLQANGLIDMDGGVARITQKGRDYLAWRIQFKKLPKVAG